MNYVRQNVRVALSNACMKLAPKLGQEHTMTHILPMLLAFLRDESAEVRRSSRRLLRPFSEGPSVVDVPYYS